MSDLAVLPWRTGRTLGRTVYAVTGTGDHKADTFIGIFETRELAAAACVAHNTAITQPAPSQNVTVIPGVASASGSSTSDSED
jgi:hypothetical protein